MYKKSKEVREELVLNQQFISARLWESPKSLRKSRQTIREPRGESQREEMSHCLDTVWVPCERASPEDGEAREGSAAVPLRSPQGRGGSPGALLSPAPPRGSLWGFGDVSPAPHRPRVLTCPPPTSPTEHAQCGCALRRGPGLGPAVRGAAAAFPGQLRMHAGPRPRTGGVGAPREPEPPPRRCQRSALCSRTGGRGPRTRLHLLPCENALRSASPSLPASVLPTQVLHWLPAPGSPPGPAVATSLGPRLPRGCVRLRFGAVHRTPGYPPAG